MRRSVSTRRMLASLAAGVLLSFSIVSSTAWADRYDRYDREHESYVFATTRGVNELDVHPALKVPLLPVAVVLDILFFPFAWLADAASR